MDVGLGVRRQAVGAEEAFAFFEPGVEGLCSVTKRIGLAASIGEDIQVANQCGNSGCTNAAVKQVTTGPPRRYCSNPCRQTAYRRRRQNQHAATAPTDPVADAITDAIVQLEHSVRRPPGHHQTWRLRTAPGEDPQGPMGSHRTPAAQVRQQAP